MRCKSLSLLLILILAAAPATVLACANLLESTADLKHHVNGAPSPIPGYCYWESDPAAGPTFTATQLDGYGNMDCPHPWRVHCDADSLVFQGAWPVIDTEYVLGADYQANLTCRLRVTSDIKLTATRSVSGRLDQDTHTAEILFPDGTTVKLLTDGIGDDTADLLLPPGVYGLTLYVYAHQTRAPDPVVSPYAGRVVLQWDATGELAAEAVDWNSLKMSFRH